jgi:alpha-amylase
MRINGIMFQYFEWFLSDDGSLWNRLKGDAERLKEIGITAVWIPPCIKGTGSNDVGYGAYDLYDLGSLTRKGLYAQNMVQKRSFIRL